MTTIRNLCWAALALCAGCRTVTPATPTPGTPILGMSGTEDQVRTELRSHLGVVVEQSPELEITAQIMMKLGIDRQSFTQLAEECGLSPAMDYGVAFGGQGDSTVYLPVEHNDWDGVWSELEKYPAFPPDVEGKIVAVDVTSRAQNLRACWENHEELIRAVGVYGATAESPSDHGWLLIAPHTALGDR